MINCWHCGLTHRPMDVACVDCGRELQDAGAAERGRLEWDATPAAIREDWERQFKQGLDLRHDHLRWLKTNRRTHAVIGGLVIGMSLLVSMLPLISNPVIIPGWFAVGAAAALYLNSRRGGDLQGAALFAAAYLAALVLSFPFIEFGYFAKGYWLLPAIGIMAAGGAGHVMGGKLANDSHDHYFNA